MIIMFTNWEGMCYREKFRLHFKVFEKTLQHNTEIMSFSSVFNSWVVKYIFMYNIIISTV